MMKLFRYPVVNLFFHLTAILPLIWLIYAVNYGGLGADPAKDIPHFTVITGIRLVIIC
ncbi:sulfoxide reductase heme-binding subunit YedZ, partial [Morganella morganii]|nr:sulfoxide reductase heme-binding subunit YedZ [Morganella morganii]